MWIDRFLLEAFCAAGEHKLVCFSFFPSFKRKAASLELQRGDVFLVDGLTIGKN